MARHKTRNKNAAKLSSKELMALLDARILLARKDVERVGKVVPRSLPMWERLLKEFLLHKQQYEDALKALAAWKREVDRIATRIEWDVAIFKKPGRPKSKQKATLEKKARLLKAKNPSMSQKSIALELMKNPSKAPLKKLRSMESRVSKALRAIPIK